MFCGCNEQRSSTETIVEHYIEDISTEGATASTLYRNNKIISTTIEIFGETGKRTICYAYEKENIAAIESTFTYNYLIYQTPDTTIPSQKKDLIDTITATRYKLDYTGNIIWKEDSLHDAYNVFPKLSTLNIITPKTHRFK